MNAETGVEVQRDRRDQHLEPARLCGARHQRRTKDPTQNNVWVAPEGGGPHYSGM
jgi:hypothetical protein